MEKEAKKHQHEKQQQSPKKRIDEISLFHNSASRTHLDPVKFNQITSARHIKFNQILIEYIETLEM